MPAAGLSARTIALRNALLRARRHPPLTGPGSLVGRRGEGYEFVELREYQSGDDPRRIDWAATARSGSVQTRVLLEENRLELIALLDTSASMSVGRRRSLIDSAGEAGGAWLEIALAGDRSRRLEGEDLPGMLRLVRRTAQIGAAVLIVSDFFWIEDDPSFERVAIELARRADVTALVARDPWHEGLPLRGFVRLRDAETQAVRSLYIGRRERGRHAAAVREREAALIERLRRAGWRTGRLREEDGRASLEEAFGLR